MNAAYVSWMKQWFFYPPLLCSFSEKLFQPETVILQALQIKSLAPHVGQPVTDIIKLELTTWLCYIYELQVDKAQVSTTRKP